MKEQEGTARQLHADDGWYTPQLIIDPENRDWVNIADMPLLPDPETLAERAKDDAWETARQAAMRCRWPHR